MTTRRTFLHAAAGLAVAPLASRFTLAQPSRRPPNVLLIVVDDLNDYVAPLRGHPGLRTPNLDRLAARSVTFTNAHCAAPPVSRRARRC